MSNGLSGHAMPRDPARPCSEVHLDINAEAAWLQPVLAPEAQPAKVDAVAHVVLVREIVAPDTNLPGSRIAQRDGRELEMLVGFNAYDLLMALESMNRLLAQCVGNHVSSAVDKQIVLFE